MGKIIAILEIKDVAKMTEEGRKEVSDWLKRQAKELIKEGKDYDKRFKACYIA
jgi:predicted HicB family RNase H-like nuclease